MLIQSQYPTYADFPCVAIYNYTNFLKIHRVRTENCTSFCAQVMEKCNAAGVHLKLQPVKRDKITVPVSVDLLSRFTWADAL